MFRPTRSDAEAVVDQVTDGQACGRAHDDDEQAWELNSSGTMVDLPNIGASTFPPTNPIST